MLSKRIYALFFAALAISMFIALGCSDDDSSTNPGTGGSDWSSINFANYDSLIQEIAPPVYTTPSQAPGIIDSMWNTGECPLLGKVFSENEPMSLYSNLEWFNMIVAEIEQFLLANDSGDIIVDSSLSEGDAHIYDYVTITELTGATSIPADMQEVLGTEISVDKLVTLDFPDMGDNDVLQIGFTLNDEEQAILVFQVRAEGGAVISSSAYYFYYKPVYDTIVMKGVFYKDYGTSPATSARWVYDIHSVGESDFAYRMSWYADPQGELTETMLGCIIGGGDKDVEFALSYREYKPADSADYFEEMSLQQVFGPNFTEADGLISSYADYLDESLFFTYDDMPSALLTSPWALSK